MSVIKVAQQIVDLTNSTPQSPTVEELTVLIYRCGETVRTSGRLIIGVPRPIPVRAGRSSLHWTSSENAARQVQALLNRRPQTPTTGEIVDVLLKAEVPE